QLQRRYLDYQVNLSNRIVALFTGGDSDAQTKAKKIAHDKIHFQDLVDDLFKETGKTIRRDKNEIYFDSLGEIIPCYKLSSGEKQMLIILLSVLVQNHRPYVLFMDEPEVSLHVEWQQRLIGLVRDLNPNAQIILTTHSPAVIMDGWADCVTDVEDIVS
nr:ATP-binding protein [Bacteroidaceae bacterium]